MSRSSDGVRLALPSVANRYVSTAIGNFAIPLATVVTAPVLARSLGVEGRGELAGAAAPLLLIVIAGTFGVPEACTYFVARSTVVARTILLRSTSILVASGFLGGLALYFASPILSNGSTAISQLIALTAVVAVPSVAVAAVRGVASGLQQWKRVNAEKYLTALSRLLLICGPAFLGHLTVVVALIGVAVSPVIGGFAYLRLRGFENAEFRGESPSLRVFLSYGLRIWLGAVSGILLLRLDQVIMVPLSGAVELGYYAISASIADFVIVVNNAVRDVTLAMDAKEENIERLQKSARLSFLVSILLGLAVAGSAPWVFPSIFGHEFSAAVPSCVVLIIASVSGVPGSVAGAALSARGRPGLRSLSLVIGSLLNIILLALLVPTGGAVGAAIAMLFGTVVAANSNIVLLKIIYKMPMAPFYVLRRSDLRWLASFVRSKPWRTASS